MTRIAFVLALTLAAATAAASLPAAAAASAPAAASTAAEEEESSVRVAGNIGYISVLEILMQSMDRLLNRLVDETSRNFPKLRQAVADFGEAVKATRLHELTHAATMKTLIAFTKALYQVRLQIESVDRLSSVVRWMDEHARGICYLLSIYREDCGYPDFD